MLFKSFDELRMIGKNSISFVDSLSNHERNRLIQQFLGNRFKIVSYPTRQTCEFGFTLIELVMTILVLSILASSALPRFFDLSGYQQRGFFDDTLNAVRYAQKLAVATGCNVQFSISSNQYTLKRPGASDRSLCTSSTASDYTQPVSRPGSGESSYQGSQSGVSISNITLYFNAQGTASADATLTLANRQIKVVKDTGFVYDSTP